MHLDIYLFFIKHIEHLLFDKHYVANSGGNEENKKKIAALKFFMS